MWKLVTGEPYAGKSHVRFGGRGGAEPSLPLSIKLRCLNRLICPNVACGAFYTAGETPRAPREPDALVLAILCDPRSLEPNALVAHIIKELRRLHGDKLDNLRDSLKMLDVLSGNRGLQDVVEETINMYIDEEKLGIYQAVKKRSEARGIKKGEARGEAKGLRKMVLRLLDKLPPEQVADLSGMSLAEVEAIADTVESA